jgi:O-antigen/teichoic acid export membrane protein
MSVVWTANLSTPFVVEIAKKASLVGLRAINSVGKFALSLYMLRYIGLADVGVFGLLIGAATVIPAVFGFGLSDWTARQLVDLQRNEAIARITTRLAFTVGIHALGQPLIWIANAWLGYPIPSSLVVPIALILFLEHLGANSYGALLARGRVIFASILLFISSGFWPLLAIGIGLIFPSARTLEFILWTWLGGLSFMTALLLIFAAQNNRLRAVRLRVGWLISGIRGGVPFFLTDIGAVGNLYFDRFLVSALLGLELTGVYIFFWSAANAMHTLVVYGVVHPLVPKLVRSANNKDANAFKSERNAIVREAVVWTALLSAALCVMIYFVVPLLGRPLLEQSMAIFWLILIATLLRMAADGVNFGLYAVRRDQAMAVVSLGGVAASAALNAVFIPLMGLTGAGLAYIAIAAAMLWLRYALVRSVRIGVSNV